jgi:hypothetical protein
MHLTTFLIKQINPLKLEETKVGACDQNLWLNPSMRKASESVIP